MSILLQKDTTKIIPSVDTVRERLYKGVNILLFQGSGVEEFGNTQPLFDPVTAVLFWSGFIVSTIGIKKRWNSLFVAWFVLAFFIATVYPVNFYSARLTVTIPLLYCMIGYLVYSVLNLSKHHIFKTIRILPIGIIAVVVFISSIINMYAAIFVLPYSKSVHAVFQEKRTDKYCADGGNFLWACSDKRIQQ